MTEIQKTKITTSNLSKLNFILIIVIGVILYINDNDNDRYQDRRISHLYELLGSKYSVDFSVSEIQQIDDVFLLANAAQQKHLTGVKFSGRVINTQSVDHLNIIFILSVDGESKEFTINRISSGNSTGFSVYIPDISIERARYAKINHVRSKIRYLTK